VPEDAGMQLNTEEDKNYLYSVRVKSRSYRAISIYKIFLTFFSLQLSGKTLFVAITILLNICILCGCFV
jgi:hypothetical protein